MLFNTLEFALFFAIVYAVYASLRHRAQNVFLLAASWFFYGAWSWKFLGLLILTTTIDFAAAIAISRAAPNRRRVWLLASLGTNLAVLGFFKYANFFVENAEALVAAFGLEPRAWHLNVVLPVGISFYTFQSMSYVIDVYRRDMEAVEDFVDFALFVSFFPQLVAGPIERATNLIRQVKMPRLIEPGPFREGLLLIAAGLFKKVFIADNCATIANRVFDAGSGASGGEWMIGIYAFAFQIYGDFSGYSDIARGLAKMMGFELMVNFNLPYFATSPSDFWHRWHISLSTWLRDYLYIPLGGNRKGERRTLANLLTTMILGGLWHGARWTMIFWGLYHGVLLVAERLIKSAFPALCVPKPLAVVGMFHLTCLGWLFFRAESLSQVGEAMRAIGSMMTTGARVPSGPAIQLALLAVPLILVQWWQATSGRGLLYPELTPARRTALTFGLALSAWIHWTLFAQGLRGGEEFIYFQF